MGQGHTSRLPGSWCGSPGKDILHLCETNFRHLATTSPQISIQQFGWVPCCPAVA